MKTKILTDIINATVSISEGRRAANRLVALCGDILDCAVSQKPRELVLSALRDHFSDPVQWLSEARKSARICNAVITHPEFVLPLGYNEVRYLAPQVSDPDASDATQGLLEELMEELKGEESSTGMPVAHTLQMLVGGTQYRTNKGVWTDVISVVDAMLPSTCERHSEDDWEKLLADSWLELLERPIGDTTQVVTMPSLYLPTSIDESALHAGTRAILEELAQQRLSLRNLHWRVLEEIVAELLHDLGLRVAITERSNDGGRDVIAKGELIPGEPTVLAVEVKHRDVVGLDEVRAALWANRHFPSLLFVTSGRFTGGVFKEQAGQENHMRLSLKDGRALTQWIDQYARRRARIQS